MLHRFILPRADVGSGIKPPSGAQLFFYEPGTSQDKDTFTDSEGTIPSTNPVIADSTGLFASIYLSGSYKVTLNSKPAPPATMGSQIWEEDNVSAPLSSEFAEYAEQSYDKHSTLAEATADQLAAVGVAVRVEDRADGIFDWVSGEAANGFDIVAHDSLPLQLKLRINGIMSASCFGCFLDSVTDDFLPLTRIHDLSVTYALDGKFAACSGTLQPRSGQTVYAFGGGMIKTTAGYLFDIGVEDTDGFTIAGGTYTGSDVGSFFNIDQSRITRVVGVKGSGWVEAFRLDYARTATITDCRINSNKAITYTGKSAECIIRGNVFAREGDEIGSSGLLSEADGADTPEGLTMHDNTFFAYEKALDITALFIADFSSNYFDGGSENAVNSTITWETGTTNGIRFVNNWFIGRGLTWGVSGELTPRLFKSMVSNNHFNFMKQGADVTFETRTRDVICTGNMHDGDGTGGQHWGYLANGFNENINISSPLLRGYEFYVVFAGVGSFRNSVSDIINIDNLADPISYGEGVNISNVEGVALFDDVAIVSGTYAAGDEIAAIDNIKMATGIAMVTLEIGNFTVASNGFLRLAAYLPGTTTVDTNVVIKANSSLIFFTASDSSIRVSIPVQALTSHLTKIVVLNEFGGGPDVTITASFDSLCVSQ